MPTNDELSQRAVAYIKENKKTLCENFASLREFPPVKDPSAYFMAGSPGAGKTEYSKALIQQLLEKEPLRKIVRIDADELRNFLPEYNKHNANIVQRAVALGVEKLLDHCLEKKQDFLLDATFAMFDLSHKNIIRCLHKDRKVGIWYLYQDPLIAWEFTKKREKLEGRVVPRKVFIDAFFAAKENVNKIKEEFGSEIELNLVEKDKTQAIRKVEFNIQNVDSYLKMTYNKKDLERLLIE